MKATWVNASAGTGKTKALVDHCVSLLQQGVKPQHILCITFTNNAAQEMQERIQNPDVAIKTLHSVAQDIIQKAKGISIHHILDSYDQEQLLRKAASLYFQQNPNAARELSEQYSYEYFLSLLKKVLYKTQESLSTFEMPVFEKPVLEYDEDYCLQFLTAKGTIRKKIAQDQLDEAEKVYQHVQAKKIYDWMQKNHIFLKHMNGILTHYLELKNSSVVLSVAKDPENILIDLSASRGMTKGERGYDFNDLILEATKLLENENHLFDTTNFFQHVLLDEAQDTSFHQWKLFRRIIENALSVFVVGDNKQNIYSFQEARPEFFEAFKEELKNMSEFEEKTLTTNYRSLEKIVTHAFETCQNLNIPLQKVSRKEEGVFDVVKDYQHIVDLLNSKVILPSTGRAIEPKDISLLFRKRDEVFEKVFDFLTAQNIPVQKEQKYRFQDEPWVKELIHLLNLQIYHSNDETCHSESKAKDSEQLLSCSLDPSLRYAPFRRTTRNDAYDLFYYDRSMLKEKGVPMLFQDVDHLMASLLNVIPNYLFEVLIDVLTKLPSPTFYTLREYLEHHPIDFEKPSDENAITMMTIHGAKGLQAPVVYLFETSNRKPYEPFLYDIKTNAIYMMPPSDIYHPKVSTIREHYQKMSDEETERLLYVAITRARDHFYFVSLVA